MKILIGVDESPHATAAVEFVNVASHVVTHAPSSVLVVKMPKTSRGSAR